MATRHIRGGLATGEPRLGLPALAGIPIYTQALLHQRPVQARLTNVVSDVLLH